uniref:Guanylate cyclase domain-containing protein n=1 Tax=Eutreptiella gymnastica TaxID=73025 RepID=A0A7S1HUJ0_9EUGL
MALSFALLLLCFLLGSEQFYVVAGIDLSSDNQLFCYDNPKEKEGHLADSEACLQGYNGEVCPPCLSDPKYDGLKAKYGFTAAMPALRKAEMPNGTRLNVNNWLSHELASRVVGILLNELMGYEISFYLPGSSKESIYTTVCGNSTMDLEAWYWTTRIKDLQIETGTDPDVHSDPMGSFGHAGLFTPKYLLDTNFCLENWRSYTLKYNMESHVARHGTVNCEMLTGGCGATSGRDFVGRGWAYIAPPIAVSRQCECATRCQEHANCTGWEWKPVPSAAPASESGLCWLTNATLTDVARRSNPNVIGLKAHYCNKSNYVCDQPPTWDGGRCEDGQYVPERCKLPDGSTNPQCGEVLMGFPSWSSGWWEGVAQELKLNFTFAYLGYNLPTEVERRFKNQDPQIFYWWTPDPLIQRVQAMPILFPLLNTECTQAYSTNPSMSKAACQEPRDMLNKLLSTKVKQSTDLYRFWDRYYLPDGQLNALLAKHTMGGGTLDAQDAACEWIKEHEEVWATWISNTPSATEESLSHPMVIIIIVLVVIIVVVLFLLLLGLQMHRRRRHRQLLQRIPKGVVTFAFSDVQGSTLLWCMQPEAMKTALQLHNDCMRKYLKQYNGFEVKTIGDCFMVTFQKASDAVNWAVDTQVALLKVPWPEVIYQHSNCALEVDDGGQIMFAGLRIRVGIHTGPAELEVDLSSCKADYLGPTVNLAARVEGMAQGGQILMSSTTAKELGGNLRDKKDTDMGTRGQPSVLAPEAIGDSLKAKMRICYHGTSKLRGITDLVDLYELIPLAIPRRSFEAGVNQKGPESVDKSMSKFGLSSYLLEHGVRRFDNTKKNIVAPLDGEVEEAPGARSTCSSHMSAYNTAKRRSSAYLSDTSAEDTRERGVNPAHSPERSASSLAPYTIFRQHVDQV